MSQEERNYWKFSEEKEGKFWVKNGRGYMLSAVATVHNKNSPKTAVVCHGLFSNKRNRLCQTIAKHMDINVIRFDFRGNGDSEGIESWSFGDYHAEVKEDLRVVVEYLRSLDLDVKVLIGHSRGAVEVLMYSWLFDDVDIIISISARFCLENSIITSFIGDEEYEKLKNGELEYVEIIPRDNIPRKVTMECLNKRKLVDYNSLKSVVNTKYFLLIHGSKDETVPVEDVMEIAKFIPPQIPHEIVIIDNGSHSLTETSEVRSLVNHHIKRVIDSFIGGHF